MRTLLPLPAFLPLVAAGVSLALHRSLALQRVLGVAVLVATLTGAVTLLVRVEQTGIGVTQLGGWPAPFGITLVADLFTGLMLVISLVTLLVVLVYAIGQATTDEHSPYFHPLYLVLAAGVAASFLAGDLFNLFVAFEVTLSASYVLITLGATRDQVRSGMTYVVLNLLASTLFLTAVGLIYAATGTVNLADLFGKMGELHGDVREPLVLLLLVAFGVKAAIFPLFFWLPDSYPTAPTPVTAVFAGLLTKVGVYAIIRTQTLFSSAGGRASTLLLVVAGLTMVVGVLGAIAQDDVKRILSFHIISQIGYMIMGLALFTVAGLAGGIYYILHHIPVKTSLFLVAGVVERATGTGSLRRLGGLARQAPGLAVLFLVAALSLAGLPPLSGFVGKLALVEAGFSIDQWAIVGVSLLVSVLTLFSMLKIWNGVFWGAPDDQPPPAAPVTVAPRAPRTMMLATVALVGVTVLVAVGARPVYELSERAAADLLAPEPYVRAVLDR